MMPESTRTLPPIDETRLMIWAKQALDIPADATALRVGAYEGQVCVWVEIPHPEGQHRLTHDPVLTPQFASVNELRARFEQDQDGQMSLDLLG